MLSTADRAKIIPQAQRLLAQASHEARLWDMVARSPIAADGSLLAIVPPPKPAPPGGPHARRRK